MATNKRWAKMVDGRPQYAKTVESIDGKWVANPTAAQYRKAGFKPYVDDGIPDEIIADGFHWEHYRWDDSGDSIICIYHPVKDPPPPPRTIDLYKVLLALKQITVTVDGQTVTANVPLVKWAEDNGLYEELVMARYVTDDDDDFKAGLAAAKDAFGFTDEQVEGILQGATV